MRNRRLSAALLCLLASAFTLLPLSSRAFGESNPVPARASASDTLSQDGGSAQRDAAQAGLAILIERSHASTSNFHANRIFAIAGAQGLDGAKLGDGFETYLVDPKLLLSGKRLGDSLHGSGEWRFVVLQNGKGIGLITVARVDGNWTMVEAGASQLADEITSVAARYAQQAPGAHLRFVRSRQAVADFIQVSVPGPIDATKAPVYVPLTSARNLLSGQAVGPLTPAAALTDAQLDDALRRSVRRGMRDPRTQH